MAETEPPTTAPDPGSVREPSLVIVNTGDGKGKSTAAFGTMLRALARGWNVSVVQFLKSGEWKVVLIGKMDDGTTVRTLVGGEGDPATDSTSRMLVESALCLAEDAEKIPVGGGSWTPAAAIGDLLLTRLTSHAGMSFELEPAPTGE